jgi:hypothetical protein
MRPEIHRFAHFPILHLGEEHSPADLLRECRRLVLCFLWPRSPLTPGKGKGSDSCRPRVLPPHHSMPTQLGERMTGSRTNPALPQRICAITAWRRPTPHAIRRVRHPPTACIGPAQRQDRSSSLRCGHCVLTPALTRRCPHGGRKPAKPLVANVLTEPHLFRDDKHIEIPSKSPRRRGKSVLQAPQSTLIAEPPAQALR